MSGTLQPTVVLPAFNVLQLVVKWVQKIIDRDCGFFSSRKRW